MYIIIKTNSSATIDICNVRYNYIERNGDPVARVLARNTEDLSSILCSVSGFRRDLGQVLYDMSTLQLDS